jgi:DNA-binding SARP family transcriptional activator
MPDDSDATVGRRLRLLGGWSLVVGGEPVALGGREQRLVALLALRGQRARAQVAGTLWPDSTDARALGSLRRAILQTQQRCPGLLRADRTSIALAPDVVVDLDDLRAGVARIGSTDSDPVPAVVLGAEELLPEWYDEWVAPERDRLHQQLARALQEAARQAMSRGQHTAAIEAATAATSIEPMLESASELVIRAHLGRGDRAGAVRELDRYRSVVAQELGIVPSPGLEALLDLPPVRPDRRRAPAPAGTGRLPVSAASPAPARATTDPLSEPLSSVVPGPSFRGTALRLATGAALVLAASVAVAGVGAGLGDKTRSPTGEPPVGPVVTADPAEDSRHVAVRTVRAVDGAAAFVVRATQLPARVRLEVAGPDGRQVVRSVVVRSRDGHRLVMGGLGAGTYAWSATSRTADPVAGQVRVAEQTTPVVTAGGQEGGGATAPADPSPTPGAETTAATDPAPAALAVPSTTPTPTPSSTPTPTPTPTPPPTLTPTPSPATTQQPSPTSHPGPAHQSHPTSEPTDPGTTDPDPVG